ncbi:MAG TPA: ribosome maturation protein RimP [Allosphingosinicella sp.]|nr:ribosome maturation protein RimP [Allosphingosinicella sp.]
MADLAALEGLIGPAAEAEGLALVRVRMIGGTSDPTLQVMAEDPNSRQLNLDDCARLSRRISDLLDALEAEGRDLIEGSYRLEVSSPGIDRPLTRLADFDDWKGQEARIVLLDKLDGRKVFAGTLLGTEGESVLVEVPVQGAVALPFAAIQSAKLVMTDKLIAATAPLSAEGADELVEIEEEED